MEITVKCKTAYRIINVGLTLHCTVLIQMVKWTVMDSNQSNASNAVNFDVCYALNLH